METFQSRYNAAKAKALKDNGYKNNDNSDIRSIDFSTGFKSGVDWAEEHGDCSMVKFFVDATEEAENSYKKSGDELCQ